MEIKGNILVCDDDDKTIMKYKTFIIIKQCNRQSHFILDKEIYALNLLKE